MFKRRSTYVMEIDAELTFRSVDKLRANNAKLAALSDDDMQALITESVTRQALDAATEELNRHGLRAKRSFEHQGHRWDSGSEVMVNRLGEHHASFTVVCEGDQKNALAAFDAWRSRLEAFGGIGTTGRVAIRGTDGTRLTQYSEAIEELAANLDDETAAMIDRVMDDPAQ